MPSLHRARIPTSGSHAYAMARMRSLPSALEWLASVISHDLREAFHRSQRCRSRGGSPGAPDGDSSEREDDMMGVVPYILVSSRSERLVAIAHR